MTLRSRFVAALERRLFLGHAAIVYRSFASVAFLAEVKDWRAILDAPLLEKKSRLLFFCD